MAPPGCPHQGTPGLAEAVGTEEQGRKDSGTQGTFRDSSGGGR
ncbi:Hypothetical protein SLIV_27818 [Streptomyces lividans TK24]|uniref:Uncharacterized protein n=1 Tax=Streptomyces lividans TK24 TaxID=457428 RepID=A0ABX6TQ01_STRLI|nr:Hypothetical protein SLIV_27818 [Streptomyces lividans TK24]QSJ12063.1 Hypothetical protein SLIVDG2_27818 [Streptomyces lividans]QTD72973.1 Hypothetical protein SLIVYQS_27818 [Streptomyces lividans TK24] [Streptomyces lividans]